MDVQIKAHNFKLTDEIREYVDRRVAKLDRVSENVTDAKFEIREEPHHHPSQKYIAQFTIVTKRAVLRAEDKNADVNAAIDIVTDRMARQIRRFHDRKVFRNRRDATSLGVLAVDQLEDETATGPVDDDDVATEVVRTKRFPVLPMDTEEAIEQMELLGHDFYVFFNADSSQMNVLYRRRNGDLGVLEPELA